MKKLTFLWMGLLVFASIPSRAGLLEAQGMLELRLGDLPVIATRGDATDPGLAGGTHHAIDASVFQSTHVFPSSLFSESTSLNGVRVSFTNATGSFSGAGTGIMPIVGKARLTVLNGLATLTIPLDAIGAGGPVNPLRPTEANVRSGSTSGVTHKITGARFTTGQVQVRGVTTSNPVCFDNPSQCQDGGGSLPNTVNTVTLTGYDNRSGANHNGRIQYVSPVRVGTSVTGIGAAFAVLTIDVVPEPTSGWLLATGAAALAALGWRRRRLPR